MSDTSPATPPANTPDDDCDVCGALLRQQAEARRNGDHKWATTCLIELQRHHDGPPHTEAAR
ncbi:hypothetical protein KN815_36535 [Streptomyces sp. 4503]|uniref:Uncharacterized protein n=1 Tax=Streptomyces niphimycinicus TaxID=2842201 RepID=A0ABS6CRL8_9ACTN|nr:hypothetical protein [Streptomyces niphimycinicus]MBU3869371.1 hypothetical protein [Streptomyces niphimycinicus]